ncbi:MAG: cytochrome c [Thermoanaerobaculia bacterium]|nr:MAG: cytochrome c [Thermoanaerobaculia bacterium]MBZ0102101.1 cytochrome c [Thermoanaerobaculia bacterium]
MRPPRRAGLLLAAGALVLSACGPPTSGRPVADLWQELCAGCHAADGSGVRARRGLDPGVDLRRSEMIRRNDRGLVFQRIARGYAAMPGFGHKLPQGDLEMLTQFVMQLPRE